MIVDNPAATVRAGRIDFERDKEFDRLDYSLEEGPLLRLMLRYLSQLSLQVSRTFAALVCFLAHPCMLHLINVLTVGQHGWDKKEQENFAAKRQKGEAIASWDDTAALFRELGKK